MKKLRKVMFVLLAVGASLMLQGCTNWEKKYSGLNVEHQNLKGLYENCVTSLDSSSAEKSQLGGMVSLRDQTIEDLERQIAERNVSPGEASGFGKDMDVAYDSDAGTITVTLQNTILFSPGKATLKKSFSAELDHVLSVINQRYSSSEVDVVGHTDSDPIKKSKKLWKDNWDLSSARALTVLRYLKQHGISEKRLRGVAAGSGRPVGTNSTSSGKARNRRVEIVVHVR
jgi:chemotaxis protein MotB